MSKSTNQPPKMLLFSGIVGAACLAVIGWSCLQERLYERSQPRELRLSELIEQVESENEWDVMFNAYRQGWRPI